jgi:F0F1-type ATP synthase membrane subunit c/vacuolar-type H+-ATPase subunit K
MRVFGESFVGHRPVDAHSAEPLAASMAVMLVIVVLAVIVRPALVQHDQAVIPEAKLTLRTVFEVWIGYWYGLMKDMMGGKRAKRYFPLIGTLSLFIVISNFLGLIPGFTPPTSSLNVTLGSALIVFVMFNYYGIQANGLGYFKHLFGPWLGWPYVHSPAHPERALDAEHGRRSHAGRHRCGHGGAAASHPGYGARHAGLRGPGSGLLPAHVDLHHARDRARRPRRRQSSRGWCGPRRRCGGLKEASETADGVEALAALAKNDYEGGRNPATSYEFIVFAPKESVTMSTSKKLALAAFAFAAAVLVPLSAFAQDDRSGSNIFDVRAYASIGAGLAIGLAALGGTLGQGRAAAAALEGISRNPGAAARIQTPMILGLALIESLVIFALLIAFLLKGLASG